MAKLQTYGIIARWLLANSRYYWVQMVLNIVLGTLYVVMSLAFVWTTKWTIDIATNAIEGNINHAILLLVVISVAEIVLGFSSKWVRAVLGVRARNKMQERLFARLLSCEWLSVRKYHTGDVLNRVMEDVVVVVNLLTEDIPSLLTTLFQLTGAFAFMFLMDKRLAVVVICIAPIFALFSKLYIRKLRGLTHEVRAMESTVQSCIQESLQHSLVVKTLERVDYVTTRLAENHTQLRRKVVQKTWYGSISQLVMNAGFSLGYLVTFVWGVKNLQAGIITYGALTAFVQLVGQIQHPIRTLTRFIPVFISAFTATERLIELEDIPLEQVGAINAAKARKTVNGGSSFEGFGGASAACSTIELSHVSYRYDAHLRYILKDFSCAFPAGSTTAIVGETGAGKTTLIRLLLALVKPTEGRVTIGGEDITASNRCAFTYVPQGNTLLSGTIRDNLLMGRPSATDDELWEVLHIAAADFVKRLPNGLDTVCSEMGGGLSEGQAQRVCIARALLRRCPVMLFDESTSALDEDTEKRVVQRIVEYARGCTLIFVTHRPAVLEHCDQVLKLDREADEGAK